MRQPKILYEDENILAVDKPAGLLTHPDGRSTKLTTGKTKEKTLADWLVKKFPQVISVGDQGFFTDEEESGPTGSRSGIVHRLDKETSGVILLAKTQKGFDCLKHQFQGRSIKKIYHAFVVGVPKDSRGMIDRPIGTSSTDFRARSASLSARGELREAKTQYMVKQSGKVSVGKRSESYALVQAMPQTGRTHQIRVHLKAIGHPIVADRLYGKTSNLLGFTRVALHARAIEFKNCEGKTVRVEANYPEDFEHALTELSGLR